MVVVTGTGTVCVQLARRSGLFSLGVADTLCSAARVLSGGLLSQRNRRGSVVYDMWKRNGFSALKQVSQAHTCGYPVPPGESRRSQLVPLWRRAR